MKAANGKAYDDSLQSLKSSCYKDDIYFEELQKLLPLLADLVHQALPSVIKVTSVRKICDAMNTKIVYKSEVHKLLRLYLTVPVTSATSERSFSALKRILTYLRSSMSEIRLNNCLILQVHKQS